MRPFVTLSASFGAGGSEIGRTLATELGVPFFDRAISVEVAERLGTSADDPLLREEPPRLLERLLVGWLSAAPLFAAAAAIQVDPSSFLSDEDYRAELDRVIRGAAGASAGGVLLGRAGAVVLADDPRALHVRLDAPASRRLRRIREVLGLDEAEAGRRLRDNDRAREAYVKQLYGADATDPSLYHLVIDSTALPIPTSVELIIVAAHARNRTDQTAIASPA